MVQSSIDLTEKSKVSYAKIMLKADLLLMVKVMFEEDLIKGKNTEIEFATWLLKRGASKIELAPDKQFYDWDILEQKGELENTYEVKDDIISEKTGNVGFEYKCNGKASGVYASKADFIVYKVDGKFYCVQRPKLLVRLDFVSKWKTKGGDGRNAELFIVKKEDFFSFVDRNGWIASESC